MTLTPLDIHNKEFNRGIRGYREQEVDEFLDQVVREMDTLLKENAALKEQAQSMSAKLEQYRRLEETLQNTLVVAQEAAEKLKSNARKEAELILREAEQGAGDLLRDGEKRADALRRRHDELRKEIVTFRARVRGMIVSQLYILDAPWESTEKEKGLPGAQESEPPAEYSESESEQGLSGFIQPASPQYEEEGEAGGETAEGEEERDA